MLEIIDRIAEMPINYQPFHKNFVKAFGAGAFWPGRTPKSITGITVHHTMSHAPLALAEYCTGGKGYPTVQYHYWVSAGDNYPVFHLADDTWALWHDHTGRYQKTISVGLAGRWDKVKPPKAQIIQTARLVARLMYVYNIKIQNVKGHSDRAGRKPGGPLVTVCPGWNESGWHHLFTCFLLDAIVERPGKTPEGDLSLVAHDIDMAAGEKLHGFWVRRDGKRSEVFVEADNVTDKVAVSVVRDGQHIGFLKLGEAEK